MIGLDVAVGAFEVAAVGDLQRHVIDRGEELSGGDPFGKFVVLHDHLRLAGFEGGQRGVGGGGFEHGGGHCGHSSWKPSKSEALVRPFRALHRETIFHPGLRPGLSKYAPLGLNGGVLLRKTVQAGRLRIETYSCRLEAGGTNLQAGRLRYETISSHPNRARRWDFRANLFRPPERRETSRSAGGDGRFCWSSGASVLRTIWRPAFHRSRGGCRFPSCRRWPEWGRGRRRVLSSSGRALLGSRRPVRECWSWCRASRC